ncbi:MAG: hypothetical protein MZU95_05445 [Desulfomicrobium escambiense]|nr:hypothetical protein [Desulfomicrobium escambiense]
MGGDVHGGIHLHSAPAPATATFSPALRDAYLRRVMERCGTLSLTGIDPAAAGQRDTDPQLRLNAVYTALLTRSPRPEEGGGLEPRASKKRAKEEPLRSALEQLDRQQRLVLQGDPAAARAPSSTSSPCAWPAKLLKDEQANLRHLTAPLPDEEGKDGKERATLAARRAAAGAGGAAGLRRHRAAGTRRSHGRNPVELRRSRVERDCQPDCVPWLWQELRERGRLAAAGRAGRSARSRAAPGTGQAGGAKTFAASFPQLPRPGHQPHLRLPEPGLAPARLRRGHARPLYRRANPPLRRPLVRA